MFVCLERMPVRAHQIFMYEATGGLVIMIIIIYAAYTFPRHPFWENSLVRRRLVISSFPRVEYQPMTISPRTSVNPEIATIF